MNTLTEAKKASPLRGHGRIITATVLRAKSQKTATVFWDRRVYISKFERYIKKRTKIQVHNPSEINAQSGDLVKIQQTRPMSKTKHFIIIECQRGSGEEMKQDTSIREKKQAKSAEKSTEQKPIDQRE